MKRLIWTLLPLLFALTLVGCKAEEDTALDTGSDTTAPTLTDDLSVSDASSDSISLTWSQASDDTTVSQDLTYQAYYSTSDNLSSLEDVATNGTSVGDATADITSFTVSGLSVATTYYFNVIVADEAGNQAAFTPVSGATVDGTAPTIDSSSLTSSKIGVNQATLSWSAGTDDVTAASELLYQVYSSSSNNLSGISDAQANGTVIKSWTANLTSHTATSLTPGTQTFFAVLVKDAAGNLSRYSTESVVTNDALVLFEVLDIDGNLGGRSGIDATCSSTQASKFASLNCANIRGFISVDLNDEIADMPTNYSVPTDLPVAGSTGTQIATNWSDLLNGSISTDLETAGINSSSAGWFSGSDSAGALSSNTCNGWTYNTAYDYYGRGGWKNSTNAQWIDQSNFSCNFASYSVLCLCY